MKKFHPRDLSASALELIAARFRALGEVNRLKIIIALEAGEKNVTSLVKETGLTQTNLSRHLQTLVASGLLARRKEGLSVLYFIADPAIFQICSLVCAGLSHGLRARADVFPATRSR